MSNLSMLEAKLPPGFRFHPRDEELIYDYLMKKITGTPLTSSCYPVLIEVDLNNCEPWDIPETACVGGKDWYFYSHRDRKYATGLRTNRATGSGYWKATGKDRPVHRKGRLLGMRKTLVFYQGRAPKGTKSDWVMHEFRLEATTIIPSKDDWVLCKVFNKTKDQSAESAKSQQPILMEHSNSYINNDLHQQVPCFSNNYKPNSDHDHDHDDHFTYTDTTKMMMMMMMMMNKKKSTGLPPLISSSSSDNVHLPQLYSNINESPSLDQTLLFSDHHVDLLPAPIWDYY